MTKIRDQAQRALHNMVQQATADARQTEDTGLIHLSLEQRGALMAAADELEQTQTIPRDLTGLHQPGGMLRRQAS